MSITLLALGLSLSPATLPTDTTTTVEATPTTTVEATPTTTVEATPTTTTEATPTTTEAEIGGVIVHGTVPYIEPDPAYFTPTTTLPPDDCLLVEGTNSGTTRWSLQPCTYDIGTPVAVERSMHETATPATPSLPATGMKLDLLIGAVLVTVLGFVLKACGRQFDDDGWSK